MINHSARRAVQKYKNSLFSHSLLRTPRDKGWRVRRIFLPKKKLDQAPSVSFIHRRFPCRRGTRVNISTPFIPVHVTFEYSVTKYTGSNLGGEIPRAQSHSQAKAKGKSQGLFERRVWCFTFCLSLIRTMD